MSDGMPALQFHEDEKRRGLADRDELSVEAMSHHQLRHYHQTAVKDDDYVVVGFGAIGIAVFLEHSSWPGSDGVAQIPEDAAKYEDRKTLKSSLIDEVTKMTTEYK